MLNLDPAKLLVIAVVAVILLGPDKLPQVARQAGAAWRTLNDFRHKMESEVRSSIPDLPSSAEIARLARSPSALLNHLSNMDPTSADPTSADPTSADGPGDESPVTGVPITPSAPVPPSPTSTVPPSPTSTVPRPPNPPDPSLN